MPGFTSLALLRGGLLAGAGASKLLNRNKDKPPLAPGPTNATPTAITPPAPPILNPADVNSAALQAANRTRKRAGRGSLLTTTPTNDGLLPTRNMPRSLLGS